MEKGKNLRFKEPLGITTGSGLDHTLSKHLRFFPHKKLSD